MADFLFFTGICFRGYFSIDGCFFLSDSEYANPKMRYNMIISVSKILIPTQACLQVGIRIWDTPKHEEEVGQGPHEFRMFGRIAGARSAEQSVILLLTTTSLYNISVKNPYSHAGLPEQSVILLLSDTTIIYNLCSGSFGRSCTTRSERCGSYFKEDYSCSFCSVCRI